MSKNDVTPILKTIAVVRIIIGCFFLGAISLGVAHGIVSFFDKYSQPLWAWWLWATVFGLALFYGFKYFAELYNTKDKHQS